MKRSAKRALCTVLALCMMLSIGCVSVFAAEEGENVTYPEFKEYTVLGDSNAAGYGLREYEGLGNVISDGTPISTAYGGIIGNAVGANTNWRAHSGWRTTDFLRTMEWKDFKVNVEPDSPYKDNVANRSWYGQHLFMSAFTQGSWDFAGMKTAIETSLGESDLVTVQFGSNDIFTYMLMAMVDKWGAIFGEIGTAESLTDAIGKFVEIAKKCPEDQKPTLLADIVNGCESGLAMFKNNYPSVIECIRHYAPDAKIVVLGVTNPIEDLFNYSELIDFDIFTPSDYSCTRANIFLSELCKKNENCTYVSATDVDGYGLPALDWDAVLNGKDLAPVFAAIKIVHPTERGHAQIAERVLDTLNSEMKRPTVKGTSTAVLGRIKLDWDKFGGAASYRVYRSLNPDWGYHLVGATCSNSFTDLLTVPGVTYYYKVTAVMNEWGTVRTAGSDAVKATAKSALLSLASKSLFSLK